MEVKCTSTGMNVLSDDESVRFMCPKCGDEEIVRSGKARILKISYTCGKCGFVGP